MNKPNKKFKKLVNDLQAATIKEYQCRNNNDTCKSKQAASTKLQIAKSQLLGEIEQLHSMKIQSDKMLEIFERLLLPTAVMIEREECARIVCPIPHVEEERECYDIAQQIRNRGTK